MSSRRKTAYSWRARRSRRMQSDEDLPLSLLALLGPKKPRTKKKLTPRKKSERAQVPTRSSEVIDLDENPENAEILNNVNAKIGNFMQSGSFISSDEDETEMIKAKTNKKPSPNQFFISDDSDDDSKVDQECRLAIGIERSEPSTSAGTSTNSSKDNKPTILDDSIMEIIDSVLDNTGSSKSENKENSITEMKSLEEFRKETEEMLKSASCLLDEFKTGRKAEPEVKEQASPEKVTVGACPVCLESLTSRPASVTVCGHIFCKDCIMKTAQAMKKCPTCRKPINSKKIHPIYF
ncbi:hypothetical protein MTP99_009517 [Tenebrio molitor]|uniref:uncharacterized protein n=1 Tax=Tenebrio molitor TaxID=7067 RepID=UPI0026F87573|nr:hypothetical protein MTP99_009517 [Tenebrio molitor]